MKIRSPPGVQYPITVEELAKKRDDAVQRSDLLLTYSYEATVTEIDKYGETSEVKKRWSVRFNSSADGVIAKWFVQKGAVIARAGIDIVEIEEPCTHEIQFGSMCVNCGKDMTESDYLTEQRNVDRARINMTHNNVALLVSQKEAAMAEEDSKRRLLDAKKLSLIVDLDQTVIHTTCERTIAEWQSDPDNPNYEALKDVKGFQLADDNVAHVAANWYYVKMRPGLKDFFDRISTMYEMHVYTMATRAYAQEVAKIIDPQRRYFGDRILSRDENYTDKLKSLQRLFPTKTDMVVIIDDRADIWHYSDNLVRVPVFNFFPGAGDINASFLPKQQELVTATAKVASPERAAANDKARDEGEPIQAVSVAGRPAETVLTEPTNGILTEIEQQLLSMKGDDAPEVLEQQQKEQEKVIITQQTERPLLQQQLWLDKEDEAAEETEESIEPKDGEIPSHEHHKHRHAVLHNDDRGLDVIEENLRRVHQAFYAEYIQKRKTTLPQAGRVLELKGEKSPKKRSMGGEHVPDIKDLMPRMKHEVLGGTNIVFSGIIPLGMDVQFSDFALWIKSFGATVSLNVTKQTTHVIANPDRKTTKVKRAARFPNIKIVNAEWMLQCCTQWKHVDETPYIIEMDAADRSGSPFEDLEDDDVGVTGDEEGDESESPVQVEISDEKWQSIGDELQDFLDESDDNGDSPSDSDSVRSDTSTHSDSKRNKRKRKRLTGTASADGSDEDSDASVDSGSKLQKRKKRAMERVTSLNNVVTGDKSSGLPSPETTGPEEGQGEDEGTVPDPTSLSREDGSEDDEDEDDDGLAAEMLAELKKSESEE